VPGELIFNTGTATAAPETRMTIESDGLVNFQNNINIAGSTFSNGTISTLSNVKIGQVLKLTPGSAPSTPEKGDIYYDNSTNKVRVWTGSAWENLN